MKKGKVFLVGAGPGNPQLLTLRAVRHLRTADVILYDNLVDARMLRFSRPSTLKVNVGKKKGAFDKIQMKINRLMVHYARRDKKVVRLKGGDPFVFGRAGEEIEHLVSHSVSFEIVPGVSSATGVSTAAGIPLIWPNTSTTFAVATGHPRAGKSAGTVPVPKADTLVYLMGVKNLNKIISALRAARYLAATPVAVIQSGTTSREMVIVSTLGQVIAEVKCKKLQPPAILVVGKTVRKRL